MYSCFDCFMQIMRQRRCERGALTLASAEVKFEIDSETHDPLDIGAS
jgi:exosome complex exonuclease DIS3/RRP44